MNQHRLYFALTWGLVWVLSIIGQLAGVAQASSTDPIRRIEPIVIIVLAILIGLVLGGFYVVVGLLSQRFSEWLGRKMGFRPIPPDWARCVIAMTWVVAVPVYLFAVFADVLGNAAHQLVRFAKRVITRLFDDLTSHWDYAKPGNANATPAVESESPAADSAQSVA